jgi:hypothetical protein
MHFLKTISFLYTEIFSNELYSTQTNWTDNGGNSTIIGCELLSEPERRGENTGIATNY